MLGNSQRLAGDYPASAASLTQALDLSRAARYRLGEATALANLGGLHDSNGDDLAAARCYQQALAMFRDLGERSFEATAIQYIGRIHMRAGDFASAAACLHEALTLRRDRGLRFDKTETLNYLGELETRTGRTVEARDYHAAALAISRQAGMPLDEATALETSASATSTTVVSPRQADACTRRSPFTSASEPPTPGESSRRCTTTHSRHQGPEHQACERSTAGARPAVTQVFGTADGGRSWTWPAPIHAPGVAPGPGLAWRRRARSAVTMRWSHVQRRAWLRLT